MFKNTFHRNYFYNGIIDEWDYVDDEAYVCDGYSIVALLDYLNNSGATPWCFADDEPTFNTKSRYLVIVDTIFQSWGEVKVFNLDRLRHQRRHERDELPYMFSWKYGL